MCPRCEMTMETGLLPDRDARVDQCPGCGGMWFSAGDIGKATSSGAQDLDLPEYEADPEARAAADNRLQQVAAGMLALPNLILRSFLTMTLLYGMLGIVLVTLVQFHTINATAALIIGVVIAALQFALGPWIMDLCLAWIYAFRWVKPEELPEHLRAFVERVCEEHKMKFPWFGVINDGAPTAFTYGHHPNNARVVFSRGILELLEPAEVEGVIAHELGHANNWDMALMTIANLVPLLLYYLYRVATEWGDGDKKDGNYAWIVAVGAYVLYIVSEYVVLWFSRTREYFADRFAGRVTGNPNALATALVKIAYGLAAQQPPAQEAKGKGKDKKEQKQVESGSIMGALNIFDKKAATSLVMSSAIGKRTGAGGPDVEQIKSAMQWDLWNPWAKFYELHSTHPLVAKRLMYLTDQAAHQGQEPLIVFDRRKPESYWDDFLVDVSIMTMPTACFLLGGAIALTVLIVSAGAKAALAGAIVGIGLCLAGLASILKTNFAYRRDYFPHASVAALLHKVKVSGIRPVPCTLTGTIIGKGVPGLIWSEDFVVQDRTGIMFLDYRQPLSLWNWLFGLFRAQQYQGKEVRVTGWFRRSPVPYMEIKQIETTDGSLPLRKCYSYHAQLAFAVIGAVVGMAIAVACLM
jgi:Zn-dependent protease with chaperone function